MAMTYGSYDLAGNFPLEYDGKLVAFTLNFMNETQSFRVTGEYEELFSTEIVDGTSGLLLLRADDFDFGSDPYVRLSFEVTQGSIVETKTFYFTSAYFDQIWENSPLQYNDVLTGDGRDDHFVAGEGDDTMYGNNGRDFFVGGEGADHHDGGGEFDTMDYRHSGAGVNVDLTNNVGTGGDAEGDTWTSIERVYGTLYHDDVLIGTDGAEVFYGHAGDDVLEGRGGDDYLDGGSGADRIDGGEGRDTLNYGESYGSVTVDLAAGTGSGGHAEGDRIANVEVVNGSRYDDAITGGDADELLDGNAGDDVLRGGAGDDELVGGSGADALDGGEGHDTASYRASGEGVDVDLAAGRGTGGDAEGDTLTGIERLHGSFHDDRLSGTEERDIIAGRSGDDRLGGRGGDDLLYGESGNDEIDGGAGDDVIYGGIGEDVLRGGDGNDILQGDNRDPREPSLLLSEGTTNNRVRDDVSQSFETTVGQTIHLDFQTAFADDGDTGVSSGEYEIYFNGVLVHTVTPTGLGFDDARVTLIGTGGLDTIEIRETAGLTTGQTTILRNVTLTDAETGFGIRADDQLYGGAGDDTLRGDIGADLLDGGDGNDLATYARSQAGVTVDLATGEGRGGDAEGDTLRNIERVNGSSHDDALTGSAGDEQVYGLGGDDVLSGGGGFDILGGGDGDDTLFGEDGDDVLLGGDGDDVASGGAGDDRFVGDAGADAWDGGEGVDTADYRGASGSVTVNLATGEGTGAQAQGDTYTSIERVLGSREGDTLTGAGGNELLYGNEGDDRIDGAAGDDYLDGGDGSDVLMGGDGSDALYGGGGDDRLVGAKGDDVLDGGMGDDMLVGGAGDDRLHGSVGADVMDGGEGIDTADYSGSGTAVKVDLDTGEGIGGQAEGDRLTGIERVFGTTLSDELYGSTGDDKLYGMDGDDVLMGRDGNDYLDGGDGDDRLSGGRGDDRFHAGRGSDHMDGGEGHDVVDYAGAASGVIVDLGSGTVQAADSGDNDTLVGIEEVVGSSFDDALIGSSDADVLDGGAGDDKLLGGKGDDTVIGGAGADTNDGGEGFDVMDYRGSSAGVAFDVATGGTVGDAAGDGFGQWAVCITRDQLRFIRGRHIKEIPVAVGASST